jgi:hypothetical protein
MLIKTTVGLVLFVFCTFCCAKALEDKVRPRADLFQSKLDTMMQDTASWLDDIDGSTKGGASAKGYLQLGWLPRTADLAEFDKKFKVAFNLPNLDERLALIIDNDNEDEILLDYESDPFQDNQESVNLAVQYVKDFNKNNNIKTRVGVSRKQLYVRTEASLNWKSEDFKFELLPRIDYFYNDGWGPSLKGAIAYYLEGSTVSFSASWQKIESEARSRRKVGIFHVFKLEKDQLLVSGAQYNKSNNKEGISNETYYLSLRYRNLIYKSWMYFEVEPFVEFNEIRDFRREVGIALSFISYYGT